MINLSYNNQVHLKLMIDWEGLLKFSIKHTDGTHKSEFKEMSKQDQKWLQEAMQHYSNSQIVRIQSILASLEGFKDLQPQNLQALLQQLQELLDSLDKGSTLYKLGGHITLLRIIFYGNHHPSRELALQIYASANQNDAQVQNQSINSGALQMTQLIMKEDNQRVKENMMSAISATIRGENLEAKRIFIRINGLQLLQTLSKQSTPRLRNKINTLIRDLLLYDDRLHYTYNDLSHFNNTSTLKQQQKEAYDLSFDINQKFKDQNELPQNAEFKGCIKKFVNSRKQLLQQYLIWLKEQINNES